MLVNQVDTSFSSVNTDPMLGKCCAIAHEAGSTSF